MRSQPSFVLADFVSHSLAYVATHPLMAALIVAVLAILGVELCLWVARVSARNTAARQARERHLKAIAEAQADIQSRRIRQLVSPHGKDAA